MDELFPESFLAAIAQLSLAPARGPARLTAGRHAGPRAGVSAVFRDYRAYSQGDDLRRVDWNVYARSRDLFLRQYEHEAPLSVHVIVDASASMFSETPTRYTTAARMAAAVLSATLGGQGGATLSVIGDTARTLPVRGRHQLLSALARLSARQSPAATGIAGLPATLPGRVLSRDVVVVLSDFFEPAGVEQLVDTLCLVPGRLVLLRLVQATDREPRLAEDAELLDAESDARLTVAPRADALRRYTAAYDVYFSTLDTYATRRGAAQWLIDAAAPVQRQLEHLFPRGLLQI